MTLEKLKAELDSRYGFDIATKNRKREFTYARKVYCKIARELYCNINKEHLHTWDCIGKSIDTSHDAAYYHFNSFKVVKDKDVRIHDEIILDNKLLIKSEYNEPIEIVRAKEEIEVNIKINKEIRALVSKVNNVLFNWDVSTLNDFIDNRLTPYDRLVSIKVAPKDVELVKGAKIGKRVSNPFLK